MWYGSDTNISKPSSSPILTHIGPETLHPTTTCLISWSTGILCWCMLLSSKARTWFAWPRSHSSYRFGVRSHTARLLYCYSDHGLPVSTQATLQRVMLASARLVCDIMPKYHVIVSIDAMHWFQWSRGWTTNYVSLCKSNVNGRATGPHHTVCCSSSTSNTSFHQPSWSCSAVSAMYTWRSCIFSCWSLCVELSRLT